MDFGGNGSGRNLSASTYSPGQVESVLRNCGVEVAGETGNDFLCYCPYHGNRHDPAFSVSRVKGTFICFNPACARAGSLLTLVKDITKKDDFAALRFILKMGSANPITLRSHRESQVDLDEQLPVFSQDILDRLKDDLWPQSPGLDYMHSRGFTDDTLRKFDVGYSKKQDMVITPMHDVNGRPLGFIGRSASHELKAFKNTDNLPKSRTLWNLHRAKRVGSSVVVVEANFDGMRVAQALGHAGVVAILGGSFSPHHQAQLDRYFDTIILMTDFDDKEAHKYPGCRKCAKVGVYECQGHNPGRALAEDIAAKMPRKNIMWASFDHGRVYPEGKKDPASLTDDQIRQMYANKVSNFVYHTWDIAA